MPWKYKALSFFNNVVLLADLFSDHVLIFLGEIQKASDKAGRIHTEHSPAGLKLKKKTPKKPNQPYKYPRSIATALLSDNTCTSDTERKKVILYFSPFSVQLTVFANVQKMRDNAL